MRLIVYSHDAFGLGNIRRMLTICQHLLATIPQASILVLSGSPAIQNFEIPARLDYIKLPCLGRDRYGKLAAKYLTSDVSETVKLRSNLIETAILNFKPDLVLVDKKPYGLLGELKTSLDLLKTHSPQTKLVLLLRDILDAPQVTVKEWQKHRYYQAIQYYYDRVLVAGRQDIFDLVEEYQFPQTVMDKTVYCGYLKKVFPLTSIDLIRKQLGLQTQEKLIVVTPGGGEDGYSLIKNYLLVQPQINNRCDCKTLIVFGSEMPTVERENLSRLIKDNLHIITLNFTDKLMSYLQAADLVISMAGYNTITEILSLCKRAVVIPRQKPSQEQLIRASRMEKNGLLKMVDPNNLTTDNFQDAIFKQLNNNSQINSCFNFEGLSTIREEIISLISSNVTINLVPSQEKFDFYPIAM